MVQRFLFQTKLGEWVLIAIERWAGLAVVSADRLAQQRVSLAEVRQPGSMVGKVVPNSTSLILPRGVLAGNSPSGEVAGIPGPPR